MTVNLCYHIYCQYLLQHFWKIQYTQKHLSEISLADEDKPISLTPIDAHTSASTAHSYGQHLHPCKAVTALWAFNWHKSTTDLLWVRYLQPRLRWGFDGDDGLVIQWPQTTDVLVCDVGQCDTSQGKIHKDGLWLPLRLDQKKKKVHIRKNRTEKLLNPRETAGYAEEVKEKITVRSQLAKRS